MGRRGPGGGGVPAGRPRGRGPGVGAWPGARGRDRRWPPAEARLRPQHPGGLRPRVREPAATRAVRAPSARAPSGAGAVREGGSPARPALAFLRRTVFRTVQTGAQPGALRGWGAGVPGLPLRPSLTRSARPEMVREGQEVRCPCLSWRRGGGAAGLRFVSVWEATSDHLHGAVTMCDLACATCLSVSLYVGHE